MPCNLIYNQIKSKYGNIAGWEVSGHSVDNNNPLIYLTDGLLKERIMYDRMYLENYDVVMLDEVHERSLNMDILIGLLASSMNNNLNNLKIIISSATLDDSVKNPFI